MNKMTGTEAIAAERKRQIEELGYDAEHDASHSVHDLLDRAYSKLTDGYIGRPGTTVPDFEVVNPDDLIKAGALIAAAFDRLNITFDRIGTALSEQLPGEQKDVGVTDIDESEHHIEPTC